MLREAAAVLQHTVLVSNEAGHVTLLDGATGKIEGELGTGPRPRGMPLAGYFAAQSNVPLRLEPVTSWFADQQWPMQFDILVGVQKDNQKLVREIDRILFRRSAKIKSLLLAYHVPLANASGSMT